MGNQLSRKYELIANKTKISNLVLHTQSKKIRNVGIQHFPSAFNDVKPLFYT